MNGVHDVVRGGIRFRQLLPELEKQSKGERVVDDVEIFNGVVEYTYKERYH